MLFNSFSFLVFFPAVTMIYFALPYKVRYIWLLLASYFFYMCWNVKYVMLILFSTISTFCCAIFMEKTDSYKKKNWLILNAYVNLGILFFFKYYNFTMQNLNLLGHLADINTNFKMLDIILPVGISFYTFQALGYTVDVYRGDIVAEKNFLKYALFVSFFPQLVAGPIERSKNLMSQVSIPHKFDFERVKDGFEIMLWGYFMKLVVADRVALFVDTVYEPNSGYVGVFSILAAALFSIQIYCDFGGYSCIAIGTAKILGINLMENFNAPFLSKSVTEFWRRWHISLNTWFRDYLYIPLGGNKKGKIRKQLNRIIVFTVSGLWHGANWTYVIWGLLNGCFQMAEDLFTNIGQRINSAFGEGFLKAVLNIVKCCITFTLVSFAFVFFRSDSIGTAIYNIKNMLIYNPGVIFDGSLMRCGMTTSEFIFMILRIFVLLLVDFCKTKGIVLRNIINKQSTVLQITIISFCIVFIITFGVWGAAYDATSFLYFQF